MQSPPPAEDARPFVAPCRVLAAGAPFRWLRRGWADLRRAPGPSLALGGVVALASLGVSWMAWSLGRFALHLDLLDHLRRVAYRVELIQRQRQTLTDHVDNGGHLHDVEVHTDVYRLSRLDAGTRLESVSVNHFKAQLQTSIFFGLCQGHQSRMKLCKPSSAP